jgi:hypothetical protein
MKIRYGTAVFEIEPAFAPTVNFNAEEGDNEPSTIQEEWDIEGSFKDYGWQNLIDKWNDLVEDLQVPAQDFAILTDSDQVVYELKAEDCISGPTCTVVNVREKRRAFLVTNILFSLRIRAERENPDATPEDEMVRRSVDYSFRFDTLGYLRITENGEVKGQNITQPPKPILRPTKDVFALDSDYRISNDSTECRYSYTWTERKVALPPEIKQYIEDFNLEVTQANTQDFLYTRVTVTGSCSIKRYDTAVNTWEKGRIFVQNPDDYLRRDIAGDYLPIDEGSGEGTILATVKDWIEENLIGGGPKIVRKETRTDIYNQRINFTFELVFEDSGLASYEYSVSIQEQTINTSQVNIFGEPPVIQRLGYSATVISETGRIVNIGERPPHPGPYWPHLCTRNEVKYPKPAEVSQEQEIVLAEMSFNYSYLKRDFAIQDVTTLASARAAQFGIPIRQF